MAVFTTISVAACVWVLVRALPSCSPSFTISGDSDYAQLYSPLPPYVPLPPRELPLAYAPLRVTPRVASCFCVEPFGPGTAINAASPTPFILCGLGFCPRWLRCRCLSQQHWLDCGRPAPVIFLPSRVAHEAGC